jgi:hypothetical protein
MRSTIAQACAALAATCALSSVQAAAAASGVEGPQPRRFGPGRCGPVDPVYLKTSGATGGQPFFLSPSEIAASARIMGETSGGDHALVLWASDSGEREFPLPVDGTITRLTLSASFDTTGGALTILTPDGKAVTADGPIEDTPLNCGRIVTIPSPEPGVWRVKAAPSGRFWLVAHARSEVDVISAEFVRVAGRPGHEGLMKIEGRPPASAPATLRVSVSSSGTRSVQFQLMSMEGRLLQDVALSRGGEEEFVGPIVLPPDAFRVVMSGIDASDRPYQRVFNTAFRGELVELTAADAIDAVPAGQEAALRIRLRNTGPRTRYRIVPTHIAQVLRVSPAEVEVDEGAEALITVWVPVPAGAAAGSTIEVMVTASSDDARETMNYVMRRLRVE